MDIKKVVKSNVLTYCFIICCIVCFIFLLLCSYNGSEVIISGKILCENGVPPIDAKIHITKCAGEFPFPQPLKVINVNKDGKFKFSLKPDTYRFVISKNDHSFTGFIPFFIDDKTPLINCNIKLTSYENKHPMTFFPEISFGEQNILQKKLYEIQQIINKEQSRYLEKKFKNIANIQSVRVCKFDWSVAKARLNSWMYNAEEHVIRQFAALTLASLNAAPFNVKIDSNTIIQILEILPPNSNIWSLGIFDWLPAYLITHSKISKPEQRLKRFAKQSPDRVIRSNAILTLAEQAKQTGDLKTFHHYYHVLETEFSDISIRKHDLKRLAEKKK